MTENLDLSQEIYSPFKAYLEKDEEILMTYFPVLNKNKFIISIGLTILGIFSAYLLYYSMSTDKDDFFPWILISMSSVLGFMFIFIGPLVLLISVSD